MSVPLESDREPFASAHELRGLLQHLQRCGVTLLPTSAVVAAPPPAVADTVPLRAAAPVPPAAPPGAELAPPPVFGQPVAPATVAASVTPPLFAVAEPYQGPSLPLAERVARLQTLAAEVAQCPRCEVLACSRKNTVFGEGHAAARVCFFGEGPGADEDATGRPFVGRSGQLLTKMIEACTFSREQVYILNTVKCRPPGNRNPDPAEIANCRPYFEEQFEIIRPDYIVCLGLVAAQTLLNSTLSIGKLRSRFHHYRGSKVLATYHPSYLLRNPNAKREAWADLKMLMRDMGIAIPKS